MLQFELEAAVAALRGWQISTSGGVLVAKTQTAKGEVCVQANTAEFLAMQCIGMEQLYRNPDHRPHHQDQKAAKRPARRDSASRIAA